MQPPLKELVLEIAASPRFQAAPRLAALLQYLADAEESGTLVKEYSIGVDVLERPPDFDPRVDSIVRVHMSRLRSRLIDYYQDEGRDAPVQIGILKGEYRFVLTPREDSNPSSPTAIASEPQAPVAASAPDPRPQKAWLGKAAIGLAAAAALGAVLYWASRPPEPAATYVGLDAVTRGSWFGVYGQDGQIIPNIVNDPPAYARVAMTNATTFTWWARTKDTRALQKSKDSTERIASLFYPAANQTNSFSFTVTLTDGKAHGIALYLCDWDSRQREQSILVSDPATGRLLDTRSFHKFQKGIWAVWKMKGTVRFQILGVTGADNVAVNGILFGDGIGYQADSRTLKTTTGTAKQARATYQGEDRATQGDWRGVYGSEGQLIANDVNDPPPDAVVTFPGAKMAGWTKITAERRALQQAKGNGSRIASYYHPGSGTKQLSIELELSGDKSRRIALYMCDWDNAKRIQTVSIFESATNRLLDRQKVAASSQGVWALWNISGNVLIEVSAEGGAVPTLGGLFFE